MATRELTPRQAQIKKLTEQGKKAPAIAKQLKITENAVYQHLRAIRGGPKKSSGSSRSRGKASTGGRQSARKRTRTAASRPAPTTTVVPATAEELLTAEIQAANEAKTEALATIDSLEGQIAAAKLAIDGHDAEIATKTDVLDVLTGKKVAQAKPKPRPARSRGKKATGQSGGGKGTKAPSGQQTAPQPGANGGAASTPAPASQAEREATADHDGGQAETATEGAAATA